MMTTRRSPILLLVLMLCSFGAHAATDPITVNVELSRKRVYVGDELSYQIIVRGSDNPPMPQIEFPSSVNSQFHGRTSQSFTSVRSINGRSQTVTDQRYSFQYTLTAVEAGTILIPSPTIEIDGQNYAGDPASFDSIYPVQSDDDEIEISVERTDIYLNETIEVECHWWIGDQTSEFSLSSTSIPKSFELRGLDPGAGGQQQIGFEINGQKIVGSVMSARHKGKEMTELNFRFSITPTETGTFELGPVRAIFTRRNGRGQNFRSYAESKTTQIKVKSVPSEHMPAGYHGAIGSYGLKAQASNTTVNVGDPITLTLSITGREPMVGVENAPDIDQDPEFETGFKVSSEGWREILPRQNGQRTYETTIRALNDSVDEIPAITLPSFNPATGAYRIYKTQPIPLVVNPVDEVTLSDAIVSGSSATIPKTPSPERTDLTRAMPGLWAHGSVDELLDKPGFSIGKAINDPLWIGIVGSGPTLFVLSLVFSAARRRSDPQSRVLRKSWRRSKALEREGHHAQAMSVYLAGVLGINEKAIVADDAQRLPINDQDAKAVAECLLQSEYEEYGTTPGTSPRSNNHPGLLQKIHSQINRERGSRL